MNMDERIKRINELYHKSQNEGLSKSEKEEQALLRREYIEAIRKSIRGQLDNVDIKEKDGSITNLGEMVAKKRAEEQREVVRESINDATGNLRTKKALLRREISEKREALSTENIEEKSERIANNVLKSGAYINSDLVRIYAPYKSEVITWKIMEDALKNGKKVAFPKCKMIDGEPSLEFYAITDKNQLSCGYSGILEPDTDNAQLEQVTEDNGICIVPGVVFDKEGYRIGYGKGFYDRFIAAFEHITYIGVAFDIQVVDKISAEQFDAQIDKLITEDNIYDFRI